MSGLVFKRSLAKQNPYSLKPYKTSFKVLIHFEKNWTFKELRRERDVF